MKYDFKTYYDVTGVYMIKNILRKGCYIGSSIDIGNRWAQHLTSLENNKHHSKYLQRVYNKDGVNAFVFGILEETTRENIYEVEQKYIDNTNCIYNMCRTAGSVSTLGKKKSKLHVDKLSEPVTAYNSDGKKVLRFSSISSAQRSGYSNIFRSIKDNHKTGGLYWEYAHIPFSLENRLSNKKKQIWHSTECLDTETGIYYNSLTELATALDINSSNLSYRLKYGHYSNRFLLFGHSHKKPVSPLRIIYLDTYTGVYYESREELAASLGEPTGKIAYRLKVGKYGNRYIKC